MQCLYLPYKGRFKKQNLFDTLVTSFLFLTFLNFATRNYYWLFMAFIVFAATPKRNVLLNNATLFLFVLGVFMLPFDLESRISITNILKPFVFVMAYTMGTGLLNQTKGGLKDDRCIEKFVFLCAMGFFSHYLLNFVSNIGSLQRNTIDFWTGTVLSATGQASLATMGVAIIPAVLFSKRSAGQKIVASLVAIVIIGYNLILAGRTLLFMLAISLIIAFFYSSIVNKKNILKIVLTIAAVATIILFAYKTNLFSVRTVVEDSNLYQRLLRKEGMGIAGDLRFDYKMFYWKHLLEYPFGGGNIRELCMHYAHDLYFDSYDQYGVAAFLAIIAYIISSLVRLFRCLRSTYVSFRVKQLLLCVYSLLNIQFLIEPVMDGMPFLLVAYCFIDGVVSRFLTIPSDVKEKK